MTDASQGGRVQLTITPAAVGCEGQSGMLCSVTSPVTLAPGAATWWVRASGLLRGTGPWGNGLAFTVP